jgi:hypothetical protein
MPEYQMNDAAIDLPAYFKDKTFHIFTVERGGSSVFTEVAPFVRTGNPVS